MALGFDQRRLECLRLANSLAVAKLITPEMVITTAQQYCSYVDGDDQAKVNPETVAKLRDHFSC